MDTTAKELLIPGAVVLWRTSQGEFTAAAGTTQLNTTNPPRDDTYFRIASNTKTVTTAVIMQLAQESKLGLNDPVSKYMLVGSFAPDREPLPSRLFCLARGFPSRGACSDFDWVLLWLMTGPLSYDWVPVVLIGFVLAIGVFVISLITLFIGLIRLRRSSRAPNVP